MAVNQLEQNLSPLAGADLSAAQFKLVKLSTAADDTVLLAAANGDVCLGVLGNKPKSGQAALVQIGGRAKVLYGGTVTRGDALMSDSAGRAVTRTIPNPIVAVAVESGLVNEVHAIDLLEKGKNTTGNQGAATAEVEAASTTIDTTKVNHRIQVDGANFSGATNFLASAAGADGDLLVIEVVNAPAGNGTVTVTFTTNFKPSATLAVTQAHYAIVSFRSDGVNWKEISRSTIIAN